MRHIVIVAPHFPPSNLAAVHRSRLFAMHLPKFGWKVTVLSVDPKYYEEQLDPELACLIPSDLRIVRTPALPTRPLRLIGDIGIRSFAWQYRALSELIKREKVDFIYIPIPPNYSAMLGPLIYRNFGIPYGIDYIDPWVHTFPGCEKPLTKAWLAYRLNQLLEPRALKNVSLITGVAPGYYADVLERYAWIRPEQCTAMPYGAEASDFHYLDQHPRKPYLFSLDGNFHLVYAGAMLPRAYSTLEAFLSAIQRLHQASPALASKLRVHFIGTGSNATDPSSYTVRPYIQRFGLSNTVFEYPARMPYLDVLNHLKHSSAILVMGSSEAHYTPSKVFQAVLARRPVFALLHSASTAIRVLRESGAGMVVDFDQEHPIATRVEAILHGLTHTMTSADTVCVNWNAFAAYSAQAVTEKLAHALDDAAASQSKTFRSEQRRAPHSGIAA